MASSIYKPGVGRHKRLLDRASLGGFPPRVRCTAPSDIMVKVGAGVKIGADRDRRSATGAQAA
ncbi:hypothetical protein BZG72_00020 [Salinivibrio sp. PR6]|nr:hypothetical protein BZG72_00020 [Salinivibrio sp. PR6]